jgi:uncharacterized coiled-coil protein SlyX
MEERIIDLEIRFARQQDELEELSSVVYAQSKLIDDLARRIERVEKRAPEGAEPDVELP